MTTSTRPLATAHDIAAHYANGNGVRPNNGNYMLRCPVHTPHQDQGKNLSVKDAPDGGLLLHCFSRNCSFNDVLEAFRRDGLTVKREWRYPGGKTVRRTDAASIRKGRHFKDSDGQGGKGVPLLIRGDGPDKLIIITEGESDADAVLASELEGVAAACFVGGWESARHADYSGLKGRRVAIWADHDKQGHTAQQVAASAALSAGAASVELVPFVGKDGDGMGAADCTPSLAPMYVDRRTPFDGPAPVADTDTAAGRHDWQWRDLGTFKDIPPATHIVNGLLIEGNITLWFGAVKTGKSRLLMGLLAAMSPGGPQFCGMDLEATKTLLFTEEPPTAIADRVRDFKIPAGMHVANEAAALAMRADDFAAEVYAAYKQNGGDYGLIAIDTLSAFINCGDWNDYAATGAAMSPLRQLARDLPDVAMLLLHHQNKAGGAEWTGALGSTALTGSADQVVRMARKNGQHTITVGGRCKPDPFLFDEPVTISISEAGVEFVGTATDEATTLLAEHLGAEETTIKALAEAMGDDGPSRDAVMKALKTMVNDGSAELVEAARGSKPALYRRAA